MVGVLEERCHGQARGPDESDSCTEMGMVYANLP